MSAIQSTNIAPETITSLTDSLALNSLQNVPKASPAFIPTNNPEIDSRLEHVANKLSYLDCKHIEYRDGIIHIHINTRWAPKDQIDKLNVSIPFETNLPVNIVWTVNPPDTDEQKKKAENALRRVSQNKVEQAIKESVPKGARVQKAIVAPRKIGNKNSAYPFALVHVASCGVSDEALRAWQDELIRDHNICTHLYQTHESRSPAAQLSQYADTDGVLRSWDRVPGFDVLINSMKQPEVRDEHYTIRPEGRVVDLRHIPFLSIDGPGCDDPEDMMYGSHLPNGNYEYIFALSYVAPLIEKSSTEFEYLLRCGSSVFANDTTLHNIGSIYKATALMPDQERGVLAMRSEISPSRGVIRSELCQALAINTRQVPGNEVEELYGADKTVTALFDISKILYADRLGIPEGTSNFQPNGHDLVREACVHAYNQMTLAMQHKGIPLFYRIHSPPSRTRLRSIRARIRNLGYSKALQNIDYPDALSETINTLNRDGHHELASELVDSIHTRGRYQVQRWPHHDLNYDCYSSLKFRKVPCAFNQFQIHGFHSGNGYYSRHQLEQLQTYMNRQTLKNKRKSYRLMVLEEIKAQMAMRDQIQLGKVRSTSPMQFPYVDVDGVYSKSILITTPHNIRENQTVATRFEGVDTESGLLLYRQVA